MAPEQRWLPTVVTRIRFITELSERQENTLRSSLVP